MISEKWISRNERKVYFRKECKDLIIKAEREIKNRTQMRRVPCNADFFADKTDINQIN